MTDAERLQAFGRLLADLDGETVSLVRLLAGIEGDTWRAPTPSAGWTIHDQVGHLAYFDEAAVTSATDPERFRQEAERLRQRGPNFADAVVAELRSVPSAELLVRFQTARASLVSGYRECDPRQRLPWYGPEMSVMSSATARLMETWAHGVDVAEALGAPPDATPRLRHVVDLGVRTFAFSFSNRGRQPPGPPPRVEVTLPDGDVAAYGDEDSPDRITGPALDFALVVAQRRHVSETSLSVTGPVAASWMEHAQVFAGPPTWRRPASEVAARRASAHPSRSPDRPPLGRITSFLFCPASRPDRVAKLAQTGTDVGVIDLEDAVAPVNKAEARRGARQAAAELAATNPAFPFVIRVNKIGSEWFDQDVEALAGLPVAGVVLPKVETPADVERLDGALRRTGQAGLPIIAGIETGRGVTGLERILGGASIAALYFGAEDLAADLEGRRTEEGLEVLYARSHVALHARVAGVAAIDQVVVRLDDDGLFERDASMGRSLGYQGKICLHPRQVPLANRIFRPSPDEIAAACRLVAAYEAEAARGGGVIRLDGEMVDEPMVHRARLVLRWADKGDGADDQP